MPEKGQERSEREQAPLEKVPRPHTGNQKCFVCGREPQRLLNDMPRRNTVSGEPTGRGKQGDRRLCSAALSSPSVVFWTRGPLGGVRGLPPLTCASQPRKVFPQTTHLKGMGCPLTLRVGF